MEMTYNKTNGIQGHEDVVSVLLDAGAYVDQQDRNQWSALMWAITNRHKTIAKILLDHGASPDIKSSSGGTAFDFLQPGTDISQYLQENGYHFGPSNMEDDFYDSGFGQGRFEEEMAEKEMKRRMMMEESAINLEVDLSSLGLDEKYEVRLLKPKIGRFVE
jgi:Ankyrin repeats (3 copies)